MATELHEYISQAKQDPSRQNLREMWRRMFMLKGWYFLPAEDREGPNRPAVLQFDDGAWLPICTDVRRLRALADRAGRLSEDGEMNILVMDPRESMGRITEVSQALEGVVFNPGTQASVRAPVAALEEFADEFDVWGSA
jgi:hypothetical protein